MNLFSLHFWRESLGCFDGKVKKAIIQREKEKFDVLISALRSHSKVISLQLRYLFPKRTPGNHGNIPPKGESLLTRHLVGNFPHFVLPDRESTLLGPSRYPRWTIWEYLIAKRRSPRGPHKSRLWDSSIGGDLEAPTRNPTCTRLSVFKTKSPLGYIILVGPDLVVYLWDWQNHCISFEFHVGPNKLLRFEWPKGQTKGCWCRSLHVVAAP